MQSSWWAAFQEMRGRRHCGLILEDGTNIVGGAQLVTQDFLPGYCFYYVPDGPVLPIDDEESAEAAWQAILQHVDDLRSDEERTVSHCGSSRMARDAPFFYAVPSSR